MMILENLNRKNYVSTFVFVSKFQFTKIRL